VTPKELEIAIRELEERVDRLRALYEQYFMGFERLEPTIARKDVERRFVLLRKDQIRNTAQRFKFNVITQKYSTYTMYWTRICRQIEEGTYKRHVKRAQARFGNVNARGGVDIDIEIDLGELDDMSGDDLEGMLADANAAAEQYANQPQDTLPPDTAPPASQRMPAPARVPSFQAGAPTSYARTGTGPTRAVRDDDDDDDDDNMDTVRPPAPKADAPLTPDRPHRPARLPDGARGRVVLRRAGEGAPPSGRMPAAPPSGASADGPPSGRIPTAPGSNRAHGPPSGRIPAAPGSIRNPFAHMPPPPSTGRGAGAIPASPATGRRTGASATGPGASSGRIPHVDPSAPDTDPPPKPRPSVPPGRRVPLPSQSNPRKK
jgi:hypothetical protein